MLLLFKVMPVVQVVMLLGFSMPLHASCTLCQYCFDIVFVKFVVLFMALGVIIVC